jgi:hypothetical protein
MASVFPSSYDDLGDPSSSDTLQTADHAGQHADVNDAVEALQAKVGADSSSDTTSLDYLVTHIDTDQLSSNSIDFQKLAVSLRQLMTPAGTVRDYIGTAAPDGWLIMDGSTVSNGRYLFPTLYASQPELFSGDDLVLFDSRERLVYYESTTYWDYRGTQSLEYYNSYFFQPPAHNHDVSQNHNHLLLIDSHTHSVPNHTHNYGNSFITTTGNAIYGATGNQYTNIAIDYWNGYESAAYNQNGNRTTVASNYTLNHLYSDPSTPIEGSSAALASAVPPSLVVNRIIKVH